MLQMAGSFAVTTGSANVVGTDTTLVNQALVGDSVGFAAAGQPVTAWYRLAGVTDDTHLTLAINFAGSTASNLVMWLLADSPLRQNTAAVSATMTDFKQRVQELFLAVGADRRVTLNKSGSGDYAEVKFQQGSTDHGRVGLSADNVLRVQKKFGSGWRDLIAGQSWMLNSRIPKTSAYTVGTDDEGMTIALGGSAFYALSLGSAGAFPDIFAIRVFNEDSGRGKYMSIAGVTGFILWPKQVCLIFKQNGVWNVDKPVRWKAPGATTLYVDYVNGNDGNDGLASGSGNAMKTMFRAIVQTIQSQWDLTGGAAPQATVQLADGTHDGLHLAGPFTGADGNATVVVQGNASTPGNVIVSDHQGETGFALFNNARIIIKNMKVMGPTNANGAGGISITTGAVLRTQGGIIFGDCYAGPHQSCTQYGQIFHDSAYKIDGSAWSHRFIAAGGYITTNGAFTFDILANLTMSYWTFVQNGTDNWAAPTFNYGVFSVTGSKYYGQIGAKIIVNGGSTSLFPGSTAGAIDASSLYY